MARFNIRASPADRIVMERGPTILVIDDEAPVRTLLFRLLEQEGYDPIEAADAATAMETVVGDDLDLVLLDVMMPATDGIDLLRHIRAASDVPVIMLTAAGSEADRVLGLRTGADDYVVKPFSPAELTARIDTVLRRARAPEASQLSFAELELNVASRDVYVRGAPVDLTPKEFDLLAFLADDAGAVRPRQELLENVWDPHWYGPTKTLDVHVASLRKKLGDPGWIETVRGVGFRLRARAE
jgi:two-component system, OmpR family, response regulator RegX3